MAQFVSDATAAAVTKSKWLMPPGDSKERLETWALSFFVQFFPTGNL